MARFVGFLRRIKKYRPATKVGRVAYRLFKAAMLMLLLAELLSKFHTFGMLLFWIFTLALLPLLMFMLLRFMTRRLLWKVRNRLIVTYVLMGLSPIVLFALLAGIAAYVFTGQFATNTALSSLKEAERHIGGQTNIGAVYINSHPDNKDPGNVLVREDAREYGHVSYAILTGGTWHALRAGGKEKMDVSPFLGHPKPDWLKNDFDGIVAFDGQLYLCSVASVTSAKGTTVLAGSTPLDRAVLDSVATGMGKVMIVPGFSVNVGDDPNAKSNVQVSMGPPKPGASKFKVTKNEAPKELSSEDIDQGKRFHILTGGAVPAAKNFLDSRVFFSAPVPITSWQTGESLNALIAVLSRPAALYAQLFATSVSTGKFVRVALISIAIVFGTVEFFALLMAFQLSHTITKSVAQLYEGTSQIDRGNLKHRVNIKRHDQLGALAASFNTMASSIESLLVQQREKDRMLNELMIAQEVQRNLFPASPAYVAGLEVHALCVPARSVSGDYFDYIFGEDNRLCIAFGDISGKGISAALLMAALHSAVRSFTLGNGEGPTKKTSPAHLLGCLNRHLFRSTQSAKYATLFIGLYDSATRELTYSNGGHLPPWILSPDGTVQHLDKGGSVVGLMDNLSFEEATVNLRSGDLLVAFTDGMTEPENADEEFGEDRLQAFVQMNDSKALDVLALDTIAAVKQWVGAGEQPDDMTILLARQV